MADLSNQLSQHSRNAVDTSLRASDVMSEDRIATVNRGKQGTSTPLVNENSDTNCQISRKVSVLISTSARAYAYNYTSTSTLVCIITIISYTLVCIIRDIHKVKMFLR